MKQLFISHAEEDETISVEIGSALEQSGFSVWYYERDTVPGPPYLDQVCDAIEQCQAVILVVSVESMGSHQVDAEVIRAFETKKYFVPVMTGISQNELKRGWRMVLGAATSIVIPSTGLPSILDRLESGIKRLGVHPASNPTQSKNAMPFGAPLQSNDAVECTVFAPPQISPGETCLIHLGCILLIKRRISPEFPRISIRPLSVALRVTWGIRIFGSYLQHKSTSVSNSETFKCGSYLQSLRGTISHLPSPSESPHRWNLRRQRRSVR
jgi:TIR domain